MARKILQALQTLILLYVPVIMEASLPVRVTLGRHQILTWGVQI